MNVMSRGEGYQWKENYRRIKYCPHELKMNGTYGITYSI
jgi:hypothetical protein